MIVRRVHVLGAAGAGKTTLGRAVGERLGIPHFETDDVYWLPTNPPFREKRDAAARIAMLREMLGDRERFIVTGSLSGWGQELVRMLDGIVWLDTPAEIRLRRLAARERERYGDAVARGGRLHESARTFLAWAAAYDTGMTPGRSRARDAAWIEATRLPSLHLNGSRSHEALVEETCRWIAGEPSIIDTALRDATDEDFAALIRGDAALPDGLAVPPGGVDHPAVLEHVRAIAARVRAASFRGGHWLVIAGGEVVGLIGYKHVPLPTGDVEIGYGIAPERRRCGHATRAVGLLLGIARADPAVRAVLADTAVDNRASQRALENNGFERVATHTDPTDGEPLIRWRTAVAPPS
ncbi:MAG TPA: GNAT family N-acetyltransferase [Candidatus Limnocylindrales bacterium]|nr:GNAT family N-acetyltransferase [Candidatus Limnocylindrales bacterium]